MKRLAIIAAALAAACSPAPSPPHVEDGDEAFIESSVFGRVRIWRDPKTGCYYFVSTGANNGGNMTPRLDRDGRIVCD